MSNIKLFESKKVRSHWDAETETWFFSVIDVIEILTGNSIPNRYWSDLKKKLTKEGRQLYEKIVQLKFEAVEGKKYATSSQKILIDQILKAGIMKINVLIVLILVMTSCASTISTPKSNYNKTSITVISEMSSSQTTLDNIDIAKFFCNNLTEYFNTYKYYKISSEIYFENEKLSNNTTAKVTKRGILYDVEYVGAAGRYLISFANYQFSGSEKIFTFNRRTVLGNAIRGKVYDTFVAWVQREEIALKANYKSNLYSDEIRAAVEIENWYNSLSND